MKRVVLAAAMPVALGISACGEYLGEYRAEDVQLVRAISPAAVVGETRPPYPEYLRIEVSSTKSLYDADTGAGLYTDADFCPLRNPHRLIAFGPVASDGEAVESWRRRSQLAPDLRDKRFHYFIYVVPESSPRRPYGNSEQVISGYDLRAQKGDVCLRFFAGGYHIVKSRSDTMQIPARMLAAALDPH